ncbi:MAG: hypothetical protein U9N63_10615 [Pseudomonadota bacterium]|nr:hypothetical protein [Pseudomonadota bacterium]
MNSPKAVPPVSPKFPGYAAIENSRERFEKLLTGFDAPVLYVMCLDKPTRDHTLLQPPFSDKSVVSLFLPVDNGRV